MDLEKVYGRDVYEAKFFPDRNDKDCWLLLRSTETEEYETALWEEQTAATEGEGQRGVVARAFVRACVKDWHGLKMAGEDVGAPTLENKVRVLIEKYAALRHEAFNFASSRSNYRGEDMLAVTGESSAS